MRFVVCKILLISIWRQPSLEAQSSGLADRDTNDGLASPDTSELNWVKQTLDGLDGEIVPLGPRARFFEAPPEEDSPDDASTEYATDALAGDASKAIIGNEQEYSINSMPAASSWEEEEDLAYDQDDHAAHGAYVDSFESRSRKDSHADYDSSASRSHGLGNDAGEGTNGNDILPAAGWGRLRGRMVMTEDKKRVSGIGEETYEDGSRYEGSLVRGQRHGSGRLCYSESMEGEWANGQETTEACYEGQWASGMRNGHGRFESAAFSYLGRWWNDAPNDPTNGRMWFPIQGAAYIGSVVEGMPDGHGVMEHDGEGRSNSGSGLGSSGLGGGRYEGNFHKGLKHGHGTFVSALGDEGDRSSRWAYVGDWRFDHRHGLGQMASGDAVRAVVPLDWWPFAEEERENKEPNDANNAGSNVPYETNYTADSSARSDLSTTAPHDFQKSSQSGSRDAWNSSNINDTARSNPSKDSRQSGNRKTKAPHFTSHSANGEIGSERGTLYQGEWVEGARQGCGRLADYWRGTIFVGRFERDQPTGNGALRLLCNGKDDESQISGKHLACDYSQSPLTHEEEYDEVSTLGFEKSDRGGALLYRGDWLRGLRNGYGMGLWRGSGVGGLVWTTLSWTHAKQGNEKSRNQPAKGTTSATGFDKKQKKLPNATDHLSRSLHSDDGVRKQRWQARSEESQTAQKSGNSSQPDDEGGDNTYFVGTESSSTSLEVSSENYGSGPGGARSGGAWWWYDGEWSNDRPEGQGTAYLLFPATSTTPTPEIPENYFEDTSESTAETSSDSELPSHMFALGPNYGGAAWVPGGASCRGEFMGGLVHGANVTCTVKGRAAKQANTREPLPWPVPESTLCPSIDNSSRRRKSTNSSLDSYNSNSRIDGSGDDSDSVSSGGMESWMTAVLERYEGSMRHGVRDGTGELLIEYQSFVNCSISARDGQINNSNTTRGSGSAANTSAPDISTEGNGLVEVDASTVVSVSRTYRGAFKNGVFHGKGSLTSVVTVKRVGSLEWGVKKAKALSTTTTTMQAENPIGAKMSSRPAKYEQSEHELHESNQQPILKQQARYVGNFANGFYHGAGREARPDGSSHEGEFRNGHPHGFGRVQFKNGDSESGQYVNGLRDGRHLFERANPQSVSLPKSKGSSTTNAAASSGSSSAASRGSSSSSSRTSTNAEAPPATESSESGATLFLQRYRLGTLLGAATSSTAAANTDEDEAAFGSSLGSNDHAVSNEKSLSSTAPRSEYQGAASVNSAGEETDKRKRTKEGKPRGKNSQNTGTATLTSNSESELSSPAIPEGAIPVASNLRARSSRGSRVL